MRKVRSFILVSLAIISVSVLGVNAQSNLGGRMNSAHTIEQKIFKKILSLPDYGVFDNISFELNGGTVTLTGKVLSLGTKSQAARAIRDVPGVTNVVNNIQNLNPGGYDDAIRYRLLREFSRNVGGGVWLGEPNPSVRIIVENGQVSLEGYVANKGTRDTLNILANTVPGVFKVTNNLKVGDRDDR